MLNWTQGKCCFPCFFLLFRATLTPMNEKKILHTSFLDGDIMVSDSFVFNGKEYLLLSITEDGEGKQTLRLLGISRGNLGKVYLVKKEDLEHHWGEPDLETLIQSSLLTS